MIANISAYQCAFLGYEVHVYASKDSEIIAYTEETAKRLGHSCKKNSCASEIVVYDAAGKGKHGKLVHRHPNKKAMKFSPDGFMSQYYHEKLIALLLDDDAQDPCDVIHFHDHFSYAAMLGATGLLFTKCVSTVHNQQPSLSYKHFRYPVTALSQNHFDFLDRKYGPLKIVEGVPYVHHGIICPETYFPKHAGKTHALVDILKVSCIASHYSLYLVLTSKAEPVTIAGERAYLVSLSLPSKLDTVEDTVCCFA